MNTVFNFCPTDLEQLTHFFKSRLDWHPDNTTTKTWFTHWGGNSLAKRNNHADLQIPWEDTLLLCGDHIELVTVPFETPIDCNGIRTHKSAMLVGDFLIDQGVLTVDAEFSCDHEFVESIWALSKTRVEYGQDSILPEWDPFETNTPGHAGQMSTSQITAYDPTNAQNVRKYPLKNYTGRRLFMAGITDKIMYSNIACYFRVPRLRPDIPFYPIIWNAVCSHQSPTGTNITKIFNLKYEKK